LTLGRFSQFYLTHLCLFRTMQFCRTCRLLWIQSWSMYKIHSSLGSFMTPFRTTDISLLPHFSNSFQSLAVPHLYDFVIPRFWSELHWIYLYTYVYIYLQILYTVNWCRTHIFNMLKFSIYESVHRFIYLSSMISFIRIL
jgi:hypothetical protein